MLDQTEPLTDGEICFWPWPDQAVKKSKETVRTKSWAKRMVIETVDSRDKGVRWWEGRFRKWRCDSRAGAVKMGLGAHPEDSTPLQKHRHGYVPMPWS